MWPYPSSPNQIHMHHPEYRHLNIHPPIQSNQSSSFFLVHCGTTYIEVNKMATLAPLQTSFARDSPKGCPVAGLGRCVLPRRAGSRVLSWNGSQKKGKKRSSTVVAAVGDLSADSTTYLFVGAGVVALLGTAFPVLFSRKDLCPECDGAGFIRKSGSALRANAARKDQAQIVCPRCNGLGKLNQIDK